MGEWVATNAISESLGLGLTLGATAYLFSQLEALPVFAAGLLSFLGAVVAGSQEATLIGLAQ